MPLLSLPAETLGAILHHALFPAPAAGSSDSKAVAKRGWKKPNIATLKGLALTCQVLHDIAFEQAAAHTSSPSHQQMQMLVKRGHQPCVRTLKVVWERKHDRFNLDFLAACGNLKRLEIRFWHYTSQLKPAVASSLANTLHALPNLTELRINCSRASGQGDEEYLHCLERLSLPALKSLHIAHLDQLADHLSLAGFPALVSLALQGHESDVSSIRGMLEQAPHTLQQLSLLDMEKMGDPVDAFLLPSLAGQLKSFTMGVAFNYFDLVGIGNLQAYCRLTKLDLREIELVAVDLDVLPLSLKSLLFRLHERLERLELRSFDTPEKLPNLQLVVVAIGSDIDAEDYPEIVMLEERGIGVEWQRGHSFVDHMLVDSD